MLHVAIVTVALAFLTISFLAFAFPDHYVRIANLYFAKVRSDQRMKLSTYTRWSARISDFALFLMLLFCFILVSLEVCWCVIEPMSVWSAILTSVKYGLAVIRTQSAKQRPMFSEVGRLRSQGACRHRGSSTQREQASPLLIFAEGWQYAHVRTEEMIVVEDDIIQPHPAGSC